MIRRPPRSTLDRSSAASDVYKRQLLRRVKSRNFDAVFLLGREFNFARSMVTLYSRARLRVGFTQTFTYPFLNCEIRTSAEPTRQAEISYAVFCLKKKK